MIKSMTGFGRSSITEGDRCVSVEIKSVNHKSIDIAMRMPRSLNFLDAELRSAITALVSRGKIDVFISYDNFGEGGETIRYNSHLASQYYNCFKQISEEFSTDSEIRTIDLMRLPDVVTVENDEEDEDAVRSIVMNALNEALEMLISAREHEGERLKEDLLSKLDELEKDVNFVESKSNVIITEYRERLDQRLEELYGEIKIDENRIAQEVVLYADRKCIDEEIVRLKSHIEELRELLKGDNEVGRRCDFLIQELNREANTTLSKSTDKEIADTAINMKTTIEKIREQIQNVE